MQEVLETAVRSGAPDVIAAVITEEGSWAGAAGIGGPDGRLATAQDEFAIGSVGMVFISTLVMRLAERGLIALDAPVDDYLGDLVFDTNGATVRQALGMRSGIPDIGEDVPAAIQADPAHHWTLEDTLAVLPAPNGPPGPYLPAPSNYVMLALAIEHVAGMPLAEAVKSELLDPVGAARILVQGAGVPTPKPWALPTEANASPFKLADLGAGDAISCIASATASYGIGGLASDARRSQPGRGSCSLETSSTANRWPRCCPPLMATGSASKRSSHRWTARSASREARPGTGRSSRSCRRSRRSRLSSSTTRDSQSTRTSWT